MNLKQVDLFNLPIPLCPFCGYPMLPMNCWQCWYSYDRTLKNFNPFRADWHRDLDEEDRLQELLATKIIEVAQKALEERPRLVKQMQESRVESWVKEHGPNAGQLERDFQEMCERLERRERHGGRIVPESQVSLISYIIGGGASAVLNARTQLKEGA